MERRQKNWKPWWVVGGLYAGYWRMVGRETGRFISAGMGPDAALGRVLSWRPPLLREPDKGSNGA